MKNIANEVPGGYVLLERRDGAAFHAACMDGSRFHGWLFAKGPDGQWVSQRKLESWEVMQVEDQRDDAIVHETSTDLRAALAIPASTAPTQQENEPVAQVDEGDDGLFVEILHGDNGSPLTRGDKLYLTARTPAFTAASEQQASVSELRREVFQAYSECAYGKDAMTCDDVADKLIAAALSGRATIPSEADERALFEQEANAARFFPRELDFTMAKSPSGRDEYANSHLQSRWEGWQAGRALTHRATTAEEVHVSVNYPDCQHAAPVLRVVRTGGRLDILVEGRVAAATLSLLNADELAALRRLDECAQDGEGYDVPQEMMQRLAEIGVVRRKSGRFYEATDFGQAMLAAAPDTATTAADQQGDTASAGDVLSGILRYIVRNPLIGGAPWMEATADGEYVKLRDVETILRAQQGAAQAQAGAKILGWLYKEDREPGIFISEGPEIVWGEERPADPQYWRPIYSETVTQDRAAMAAPATSGGGNG